MESELKEEHVLHESLPEAARARIWGGKKPKRKPKNVQNAGDAKTVRKSDFVNLYAFSTILCGSTQSWKCLSCVLT